MAQDGAGPNGSHGDAAPAFTTLVADRERAFAAELLDFFRAEGHVVVEADSAVDAIRKTGAVSPDLILMDSRLAGADGLSLLVDLLMEHPSAAVIVMAEEPTVPEAVEAMRLGAVDYLGRVVDPARFRLAIAAQKSLLRGGA